MTTDIRPYLQIRTTTPSGFNRAGDRLLMSSNLSGTAQVHRLDVGSARTLPVPAADLRQITGHSEPVGGGYLPDADRLLLVTDAGGDERHQLLTGPDDPAALLAWDDMTPLVVDRAHIHRPGGVTRDGRWLAYATNRRDGVAFDAIARDLRSGDERVLWDRGGAVFPVGWSPDGTWLAASELTDRAGDNRLHLVGRDGDRAVELFAHDDGPPAAIGGPSWLPDARTCFVATSVGSEFVGVHRLTVESDGTVGDVALVVDLPWDAGCAVDWHGRHLLVTHNDDGISRAELRDPVTLAVTAGLDLPGEGVAGPFRFSRDGRQLAYGFSSPLVPGDVWRYDTDTGVTQRLTVSPCDVDPATFVPGELVRCPSFDGLEVPAFVFRPVTRRGPRHPVVVIVHGGPESQWRPSFSPLVQYLAARGYAVVAPNVRGSTGYGRRYQHLDDVEKRLDSVADLAAVHDWIAATDDLDPGRCALYGGSYGGYMVLSGLVHQPDRWAAAVDVVGIANLVSFLEHTSPWRRAWREREYGSLADDRDLLEHLSPLTYVDRLRAPLLIIHGRNDPRVPVGEAEQIHRVARAKGLRSDLLVYDDEGHGLARLANRLHAYPRVAAFLDDVLG